MKLYGSYTSPFVRHCRIVLAQTGTEYSFIETDYSASADQNPTKRVPFADTQVGRLHDSAAILKYVREQAGQSFFPSTQDYDLFCLANTLLDTSINLFLLSKENIGVAESQYLGRQQGRIESTLNDLEARDWSHVGSDLSDGELRLACYLSWAIFRGLMDIAKYPNLQRMLTRVDQHPSFANTHPALS